MRNASLKILVCLIITLTLVNTQSCELVGVNPHSPCLTKYPEGYGITALITLNAENPEIRVAVYKGSLESTNLRYEKTLSKHVRELWLQTDIQYTAIAFYQKDGRTYQVVGGIKPYVSQSGKCYYVNNTVIDLRLKD
jgi:hypothetical protein